MKDGGTVLNQKVQRPLQQPTGAVGRRKRRNQAAEKTVGAVAEQKLFVVRPTRHRPNDPRTIDSHPRWLRGQAISGIESDDHDNCSGTGRHTPSGTAPTGSTVIMATPGPQSYERPIRSGAVRPGKMWIAGACDGLRFLHCASCSARGPGNEATCPPLPRGQ